jgi:glycosyltransferase involved in cell wall biosynthesis
MGERKRLCIVDPNFSLDSPTMKHLVYAIPFLIDAGWLVTVIAEKIESDLPVEFQRLEPRIEIPVVGDLDFCRRVLKSVRDFRDRCPKAVIVGTPAMPYGAHLSTVHFLQHLWLSIARKVPGMDWRERAWLLLARVDAHLARKDFNSNHGTIWLPVSESIASELRKVVATPEKVHVLPNSYDESRFNLDTADRFRGRKRAELNFGSKDFVFAFLCQGHHRRKGFWVAIQALASLRKKRPDYDPRFLVIGGTPTTLARLKKTLSREIGDWRDWIHFTGMTELPEEYLAAADAFLLPSYFEAFCLAEIEAAAIGLPLLLTPHHGVEMILDHGRNGLMIDWDPAILSNQLLEFVGGHSPLGAIDPVGIRPRNFRPNVGRALNRGEYSSALLALLETAYEERLETLRGQFAT